MGQLKTVWFQMIASTSDFYMEDTTLGYTNKEQYNCVSSVKGQAVKPDVPLLGHCYKYKAIREAFWG